MSPLKTQLFTALVLALSLNFTGSFVGGCLEDTEPFWVGGSTLKGQITRRGIVGGEETNGAAEWAGVVAVLSDSGLCTGTLIDPQVVLTAGHCVLLDDPTQSNGSYDYTTNPSAVRVIKGAKVTSGVTVARGEKIVVHPSWTGQLSSGAVDLSLIKLDTSLTSIESFEISEFPMPEASSEATIVGYGQAETTSSAGTQRIGTTTVSEITAQLVEIKGKSNICSGDSGGPVFVQKNGEYRLVGVNSFGLSTTCTPESTTYSVNVLSACDWLNEVMEQFTGHDLGLETCTLCREEQVADWGEGCGSGIGECPAGTVCLKPEGFSVNGGGYCAAACCEQDQADPTYCFDISAGDEMCNNVDENGHAYCVIHCASDADCPKDTICRNKPFESEKICIAQGVEDTDTESVTDSASGWDTESAPKDSDAESLDGGEVSELACGCREAGVRSGKNLFFFLWLLK